jgi:hypothetical protein
MTDTLLLILYLILSLAAGWLAGCGRAHLLRRSRP